MLRRRTGDRVHISLTSTFYGGAETGFPVAVQALEGRFPNSPLLLDVITDLKGDELRQCGRWQLHILGQLTFSYLSKDYLTNTVLPVLENVEDDAALGSLKTLVTLVEHLSLADAVLDGSTIPAINDAALAVAEELRANHAAILRSAMNRVGRWFFASDTAANRRAMRRALNLLFLALCEHINETTVCRLFREAVAPLHKAPEGQLKNQALERLTRLRDDLCRRVTVTVIFVLPDIKMHCDDFAIGPAMFRTAASATSWVEQNGNAPALGLIQQHATRTPFAAFVEVASSCHPSDAEGGIPSAAERLELVTGFIASQAKEYAPARRYAAVAFAAGQPGSPFGAPSGAPSSSLFLATQGSAETLATYYRDYIQPALNAPVEPALQEKLRRTLLAIRRARFGVGCTEYSQAFSAAWQALELVFGGAESRERGATISKRVAAMAVGPDGQQSNDSIVINDDDLVALANGPAGAGGAARDRLSDDALSALADIAGVAKPNVAQLSMLRMMMVTKDADAVMDWVVEHRPRAQVATGADTVASRQDALRARLGEFYKLRNDIVHSGQCYEPFAELATRELVQLVASFLVNMAFNFRNSGTVDAFHQALDDLWRSTHPVPPAAQGPERMEMAAFLLWSHRGRPHGDAWADWFAAERIFRL